MLLTPLLGKLAGSKDKWIGFLIAPLATVGYTYSKVFIGYQPSYHLDALWGASCLGWMGYYYLGLLLGNHLIQAPRKWLPLLALYLLSIPLQMGEGYVWYYGYGANYCGTQIKLTSFITSSIFLLLSYLYIQDNRVIFSPTWLRKIGDCSFGIYLVHGVVMSLFSIYTSCYGVLIFGLNTILVLLSSLLIVVLTKYIFGPMVCRYIGFT